MAEQEPVLASPPTQEDARHVRDYSRFLVMLKYGAIASFIIGIIVVLIIAN